MNPRTDTAATLEKVLRERIVILDGAMGTMLFQRKLTESEVRGSRFKDWKKDLSRNPDVLVLTQPNLIENIHAQYFAAGADIVETDTFSATTIGQHEFFFGREPKGRKDQAFFDDVVGDETLRGLAREINLAASQIARRAAKHASNERGHATFVAGALGPMPASACTVVLLDAPAIRAAKFDPFRPA